MIIGTAGHIDHGKSTLVSVLTGRPMDRLPEERRREITIELNFAPLELGGAGIAGVVDVPGHEDFVRTMVAGASGIDLALLVVAADEGIMPQTEEHLIVLEQLGVPAGIPVVTKADLVDPEWLQLVMLEVAERLAQSPVAFEAPLPVSAQTGEGISALRQRLGALAGTLPLRSPGDGFRMPVDRVFSLAGVGTVVTGTAWSGRLAVGDTVLFLPSGERGRVRSLESFGLPVDQSRPGARTAVGLAGIDRVALSRGEFLVTDELPWAASEVLDVELSLQPGSKPLSSRSRVRVLHGTAEVMARVLPRGLLGPEGRGTARLKLERPIVARGDDRFVLRSYSPVATIGGGRVLDPLPPPRRSSWPESMVSPDPSQRFSALLERRPHGLSSDLLPIVIGLPSRVANETARKAGARLLDGLWVTRAAVEKTGRRALSLLKEFHRRHPGERGMPLQTLRQALRAPGPVVEAALTDFARAGRLRHGEGSVTLAGFSPRVPGGDAEIERIVRLLEEASLSPPSIAELERSTGKRDLLTLLRLAASRGQVEAVERDRYYTRQALNRFVDVLRDMGRDGSISPAAVRDRLGISRKYLIPLLEWADDKGITIRVGDGRRLKSLPGL